MRYLVMSGVIREEFLAETLEEGKARARLSALNNDQASVWVEVSRYERSEDVQPVLIPFSIDSLNAQLFDMHVALAQQDSRNDASGSR